MMRLKTWLIPSGQATESSACRQSDRNYPALQQNNQSALSIQ